MWQTFVNQKVFIYFKQENLLFGFMFLEGCSVCFVDRDSNLLNKVLCYVISNRVWFHNLSSKKF